MAKRGAAMLDVPVPEYAPGSGAARRLPADPRPRRELAEDFEDDRPRPAQRLRAPSSRPGIKLTLRGRLVATVAGRIWTAAGLLAITGMMIWLLLVTRTFLLHDARFRIASPASIEIAGNRHLTRPQLLSLFSDDIERNTFRLSLDQRRAELETLPWVERATVMRLLPGRIRVALVERTPVAFVRQGGHIGMVDAHGVLLDMAAGDGGPHFSFPVVTGINAGDPASTRAARMKMYTQFVSELDDVGEKNTEALSEVDLSNPEDIKALVEEHSTPVLVHFGESNFLARFHKVKELLPQWHAQYPNLASADMRYEHEIPLAMATPTVAKLEAPSVPKPLSAKPAAAATKLVAKPPSASAKAVAAPVKPHPVLAHAPVPRSAPPSAEADWAPLKAAPSATKKFVPAAPAKPWQQPTHPAPLAAPYQPKTVAPVPVSVAHGSGKKPAAGTPGFSPQAATR